MKSPIPSTYHSAVKQFEAKILENRVAAPAWRELVLAWDSSAGEPRPGQFLTIRVSPFSDPLLRRPFAFSSYAPAGAAGPARVGIVYQIRGNATTLLAGLAAGDRLDTIAPLGKSFPLPGTGERAILAGGGIGLGPLLFLSAFLSAAGQENLLVLGLRSASLLPSIRLPEGTVLCTDDGSSGFKGTPVDYISKLFQAEGAAPGAAPVARPRLYGCGPLPMLAGLATLAADRDWPASLSAEQWMACGVGACMGCALPRADGKGYLRACTDGPVFEASVIDWAGRT